MQVARELGLYAGGGMLRRTGDPARWEAFTTRIGLHRPNPYRWWVEPDS